MIRKLIALIFIAATSVAGQQQFDRLTGQAISAPQTSTAPVQIAGVWYPGTASGLASAPSTQPGSSVVLSGGSIADGTYYCKTTNWNQNGETPGSPTRTVTVTGGGGAAKINIGDADFFWLTGAPGFRVYCSNDNVTFYRQTPNPVVADFMIDSFTHYNRMGSFGARLTSLTFSGTQIPTTNTATITNLQVALNSLRRPPTGTSPPVPFGALFIPAVDGTVNPSGQFNLTTPLVAMKNDDIRCVGSQSGGVDMQTRIFDNNTWNNTKLGVVMVFGGDAHISNCGIMSQSAGGALMILGGAGYQGGTSGPMTVSNVALRNTKTTTGYASYVAVGILFDVFFHNVSLQNGFYDIEYRNISGSGHSFTRGRWDAVEGFIRNVVGPTDPDNGINDGAFPNGLGRVFVMGVRTEGAAGIPWDIVNLDLILEDIETADMVTRVGTDSILKMGQDGTYNGTAGAHLKLINSYPGQHGNARVGVMNSGATNMFVDLVGASFPGFGASSGVNVGIDANNQPLFLTGMVTNLSNPFTVNPSPVDTASVRAINVNNNSRIFYFGGGRNLNGEPSWSEITGRLVLVPENTGTGAGNRALRASFFNDNTNFKMLASDDSTVRFTFQHTGSNAGLLSLTSLRVGTNPAQVGGSSGDIGIRNSGGLWWRNNANSADLLTLYVNTSDTLVINRAATTASQFTSTLATGTAPFSIASITPVATMVVAKHPLIQFCGTTTTCSATAQTGAQTVYGSAALVSGTPSTATVTGISPTFTSSTSYVCTVTAQTAAATALLSVANVSGSSFTITGPATDTRVVNYSCTGI